LLQTSSQLKFCTQNYGPPKLRESQLWELCHLDVCPVVKHRVYYKREGGGFPQVQDVVNLVSLNFPLIHPNTKSAEIIH
jgi:hypothetical protein